MAFDLRRRRRPVNVARGNAYAGMELEQRVFAPKGMCLSQHDQNIANDTGAAVRSDLNNALGALFTLSSGAAAPSTTIAYMLWADTTNNLLKQRNAANTGWLVRGTLAETFVLARASNTIVGVGDFARTLNCTGTFTQTLTAAATLGDGFLFYIRNNGTGVITIDPNGSETIDGSTTINLAPGEACAIFCNGTLFVTIGRSFASKFFPTLYRKNAVINGNFDFWQRGTSHATPATNGYTADRWRVSYDGTIGTFTVSRATFSVGGSDASDEANDSEYYIRWDHTSAGSGSTFRTLNQQIESVRTFANQTITISFWGRADAARTVATGLVQRFGSGGSPSASVSTATQNHSFTTSFQKFTHTLTLASISGKTIGTNRDDALEIAFFMPLNTTMTIDIARVQIEAGSVATEFERRKLAEELEFCQRYYEKSYSLATDPGGVTTVGAELYVAARTANGQHTHSRFKTKKRAVPTVTVYSPASGASGNVRNESVAADAAVTAGDIGETGCRLSWDANDGQVYGWHWTASAEL